MYTLAVFINRNGRKSIEEWKSTTEEKRIKTTCYLRNEEKKKEENRKERMEKRKKRKRKKEKRPGEKWSRRKGFLFSNRLVAH